MDPEGRGWALVTGGAVRLGRAISLALGAAGYDVIVHYHKSEREAEMTVGELQKLGCSASSVRADLTRADEIGAMFDPAAGHVRELEILVNSAAAFSRGEPEAVSAGAWDEVFALNARAPFLCAREALASLRARRGAVINVADIAAFEAWRTYVPYAASKAALVSITRGLARAWAPEVRVNAVCPGAALLPAEHTAADRRAAESRSVLGRVGTPEDIGQAVVFLAKSRYITGEVLAVDGGTRLRRV